MPNNQEHLAERRQGILVAAGKVFDAHGYAATTMEAVAAEAGISKGSIYNYFENKRDLFVQLFSDVVAGNEVASEKLLSGLGSARTRLESFLDDWTERAGDYKRIGRLLRGGETWSPGQSPRVSRRGSSASKELPKPPPH